MNILVCFYHFDMILDIFLGSLVIVAIPTILWLFCYVMSKFFPPEPGIGSPWELNRQTGMVSVYTYNENEPDASPEVISAPFYKMDAFIINMVDRYGVKHFITMQHRFSDLTVKIGDLIGVQSDLSSCDDLWDFIQNYMDTSKPLPDIPTFEKYRSQDPTTAQYDQKNNRNPRYWIDMNNEDWKIQCQKAREPRVNGRPAIK